jgi:nucleotide sugar dehydrogenase
MKICVVGANGVVGSAVMTFFIGLGHDVLGLDLKPADGVITDVMKAYSKQDFIFVCVPTPAGADGACDLSIVEKVTVDIGRVVSFEQGRARVVYKSTMPPGSTVKMEKILKKYSKGAVVAFNPEFLRQNHALEDMMRPSRIVVGSPDTRFCEEVMFLYDDVDAPKFSFKSYEGAELIKYYANCYYATRISFFNQMKLFADYYGADHDFIVKVIVADGTVGVHGSNPTGRAFGGACLPKDLSATIEIGRQNGLDVGLLENVDKINKKMSNEKETKAVI